MLVLGAVGGLFACTIARLLASLFACSLARLFACFRYPLSGGELVPLVFEAGGCLAEETLAFVRSLGLDMDDAELGGNPGCLTAVQQCIAGGQCGDDPNPAL